MAKDLAKYIDHTLLKPQSTLDDIKKLCEEASRYAFCSVCVNSCYVKNAFNFLTNKEVKVCSVVGFPLGAMTSQAKAYEAKCAIEDGASEIDMVINIGYLKSKRYDLVEKDIKILRESCKDTVLKVILETALLDKDEIVRVCEICKDTGADFVKTSTGFSSRGASIEDIKLFKSVVKDSVKIKASGGIRDYESAVRFIEAGADRLGVSSGVAIMEGQKREGER